MKIVYLAFIESPEIEGMFESNGKLISSWYSNDATWRDEYFDEFMDWAGIKVKNMAEAPTKLRKKMVKQLEDIASE